MEERKKPSLNEELQELWGADAPRVAQALDSLNSATAPVDLKHRILNRQFGTQKAHRSFRFGFAGAAVCGAALCALLVLRPQQVEQTGPEPMSDDEATVLSDYDSDAAVSQLNFDLVTDADDPSMSEELL